MHSERQNLPDLFGDQEYHQDFHGEPLTTFYSRMGFIIPFAIFIVSVIYHTLYRLDYDLLPLPELLWNCLVYVTPYRLLDVIESYRSPLRLSNSGLRPRTHAAKSEMMRQVLGLDARGGIMAPVGTAARKLSTLPGISKITQLSDSRPPGLGNWDNSCYQNSVLQGLTSLGPTLSNYLATPHMNDDFMQQTVKPQMKMADALRGLIATLKDPSNNGRRIWTPATLKSMSSLQQQDAQEYFSNVLDQIDREMAKAVALAKPSHGIEGESTPTVRPATSNVFAVSDLRNPLEGMIAQRVGCTNCGYSEGLSMIPFNCLTVPLGRAPEYNISQCLDEYTKLEQIEGVKCGKCTLLKFQWSLSTISERLRDTPEDHTVRKTTKERLEAVNAALEDDDYEEKTLLQKCKIPSRSRVSSTKTRQAVIARPPKSLVVHFNRSVFDEYTGELKKNYAEVRFPKFLDLGPWCLGSSNAAKYPDKENWTLDPQESLNAGSLERSRLRGPLYELRAVVTHYGRHNNGHYICYRKHSSPETEGKEQQNEQWWRLSDDDVSKVSEENVLGQGGVFMLFFDCVEPSVVINSTATVSESLSVPEHASLELDVAASVPLPDIDDSDILEVSELTLNEAERDKSVADSTSDYDDDEEEEATPPEYRPAEPIHVQPFIRNSLHSDEGGAGNQDVITPKNLVMV
ncbi:hypothetical protein F5884DRAFT_295106 [Xylogone sp. PMI_703]|nr:hypothetical protein F5884DRAFT_295106 [Xylogone sp. PMI_703]